MILYKIYVGTGKYDAADTKRIIQKFAGMYFDGYTLIDTEGYWKGEKEDSFILEVITEDTKLAEDIGNFITKIKAVLEQQVIMLTMTRNDVKFI